MVAFEALIIGLGSEDHKSFSPTSTIQICPLFYILTQLNKQNMEVRMGRVCEKMNHTLGILFCHLSHF